MKLTELFTDENAASPVVGVILVIGIVVILAAGIGGTLVSTLDTTEPAPSANYDDRQGETHIVADGGNEGDFPTVTINHDTGDQINASRLAITVNGERGWDVYPTGSSTCSKTPCHRATDPFNGTNGFSTGDSVRVVVTDHEEMSEGSFFSASDPTGAEYVVPNGAGGADEENNVGLEAGDEIRLVWLSEDRESSQTLYTTEVSGGL
jgi:FlaG/FlaF family flagellin (archaellin)